MLDEYNQRYINNFKTIQLTALETYILATLIQNKKRITTRKELRALFDLEDKEADNSLRVHIWKLKEKLKGEIMIMAVYSVGYKIEYIGG